VRARADAKKRGAKQSDGVVPLIAKAVDRENSADASAAKSTASWAVGKENSSNDIPVATGKAGVDFHEAPPLKRIARSAVASCLLCVLNGLSYQQQWWCPACCQDAWRKHIQVKESSVLKNTFCPFAR
jgi:hypothetical protein